VIAGHVPIGTMCRIDDAMVSWDDPQDGHILDMYVSQNEDEDLYYALVLDQDDVKVRGRSRRLVRCLALGFETGPDNTFWMLGSQHLKPL
jgi:hypothetical protein